MQNPILREIRKSQWFQLDFEIEYVEIEDEAVRFGSSD